MKTTRNATRGLAAFGLAALPLAVQAQAPEADTNQAMRLNPLVVTAALAPRTADETLASVTVLDEATLRRQDPTSVTDLLRGQPGVDITTQGSFGKQSSLFLRGTGSNAHVLLIDGIRLRAATTGAAAWEFLDPRMFERAEIVRGPRGSLFGADAVGGVVQLFTPKGEEGAPQPRVSVGGGSFNTQRYSASLTGSSGGTRYYVAGSRFETDGAPVRQDGDDKGHDNTSGLVRLSHTFNNHAEVGLLALRSRGSAEFDAPGAATDGFLQQVAGVYAEQPLTDRWRSRLTLSEARDERDTQAPTYSSLFETRTRTAQWHNTLALGPHELVAGAEYAEDDLGDSQTSGLSFDEDRRYNRAVFAQGFLDFHPLTTQLSLRHDDNQAFGEELTGSLALGYALDEYHVARASYGSAFRAPTFNELYFPFAGSSNPDLKAETSSTVELGLRGQYGHWFWDLAAYQTEVEELIALDEAFRPVNVHEARIRGAELALGAEVDDWALAAALTWMDPENRSGDNAGKRLARRATQGLRLDLDRELGDWSLGGSWVVQNHRYNDAANAERLPGHGTVNLRAGWDFAPMWSLRATLDNVLDKEVVTAQGAEFDPVTFQSMPFDYINAGRAAFLSLHFGG
ncbi:TonB-dependent receptor [Halomonas campisalis]|uniref:TonB-dependent receptor n=1 Tax=Billgrantia campisalis TaxID=74661 RepID=A0ABS9PAK5_9GAMM|nr:TonB-dependent receptor [Halomonas campisalis]MCG6658776.1 TonB-dependent receptor [Halomonas campisalis]MDR5864739.1 TonB-dependent receptor [Halomonas campisalis]